MKISGISASQTPTFVFTIFHEYFAELALEKFPIGKTRKEKLIETKLFFF